MPTCQGSDIAFQIDCLNHGLPRLLLLGLVCPLVVLQLLHQLQGIRGQGAVRLAPYLTQHRQDESSPGVSQQNSAMSVI